MKKQINIQNLLNLLELPDSCFAFSKWEYHRALEAVKGFKELVKKQRKRLAKKYHPDNNGGDGTRMKEINNAVDILLTVEVEPIRKHQLRPGMVFHRDMGTAHTNYGTTTDSTFTWRS